MGTYDTAQICLNGHVITSSVHNSNMLQKFCSDCGEPTITACQHCNANIKGDYNVPNVFSIFEYYRPSFCDNCGQQYPWTQSSKDAAYELIQFTDSLNENEKDDLKNSINDLLKDSPKTKVAEIKFKKYALKAGKEVASGLKDILIDIVSETAKKSIWGI